MTSSSYRVPGRHAYPALLSGAEAVEHERPSVAPAEAAAAWHTDPQPGWPAPAPSFTAAPPQPGFSGAAVPAGFGRPVVPAARVAVHDTVSAADPDPVQLLTPEFLGWVAGRIVSATIGHAYHALQERGNSADEPGPHALLILSADTLPHRVAGTGRAPVTVRCESRLFHPDDADDLLSLLADITTVIRDRTHHAGRAGQLYQWMSPQQRVAVAREALRDRRWQPGRGPFPYQEALDAGLVWDPRSPTAGLVGDSKDPLSVGSMYVGVSACTLDTDRDPWADAKHRYAGRDPRTGMEYTSTQVPAQAWAWLHGDTALHLRRGTEPNPREYVVRTTRRIADGVDSYRRITFSDTLVARTPPASATASRGTTTSQELWQHLHGLHTALGAALDRRPA